MKQLFTAFLLLLAIYAKGDITLPAVLGNNMVLQQQSTVKLWGWGSSTEKIFITTSWDNKTDSVVANGNATWQLDVQTPKAGGPYTITFKGRNTITLSNVLIGEVWVCSGQSNMEYHAFYKGSRDAQAELPYANNPNIRFFQVPKMTAKYPQENLNASWAASDSNTLKNFSQVAYFFGKKLNKDLNVPIGLILAAWGGTPAETWTPTEAINNDKLLKDAIAVQKQTPWWPKDAGLAYNSMLAPLTNFKIAGALWYQGEGNTATATTYKELLSTMINSWRKEWNNEFPFYIVQIGPYKYGNKYVGSLIREAQAKTAATLPKTGYISINDLVDDVNDIHPWNKKEVGVRLANLALVDTYKQSKIVGRTPEFKSISVHNSEITVEFNNVPTSLIAKNKEIADLFIAGSDQVFHPAQGKIKKGKLIVSSKLVKQPVAVRYAFSNAATGNLFTKEGLPVASFRSDEWPLDTSSEK
ncbi:MAG: sialate O-acetylesterase [Sphingobacteriales bacterium]|nr:sialate O-acetylesterase [Sphingobacteriales bacterium]